MVRRCPRCGNYASVCLTYCYGESYVEYRCGCGWSSLEETYISTNKTFIDKEETFYKGYDSAGNYHMIGTRSGHRVIRNDNSNSR